MPSLHSFLQFIFLGFDPLSHRCSFIHELIVYHYYLLSTYLPFSSFSLPFFYFSSILSLVCQYTTISSTLHLIHDNPFIPFSPISLFPVLFLYSNILFISSSSHYHMHFLCPFFSSFPFPFNLFLFFPFFTHLLLFSFFNNARPGIEGKRSHTPHYTPLNHTTPHHKSNCNPPTDLPFFAFSLFDSSILSLFNQFSSFFSLSPPSLSLQFLLLLPPPPPPPSPSKLF